MAQVIENGTVVEVMKNESKHDFPIGTLVTVTKMQDGCYICTDESGDFWWMTEEEINPLTQEQIQKNKTMKLSTDARKNMVYLVAKELAVPNNTITTLEIKMELRKRFPDLLWNKYNTAGIPGVSDLFHDLVREGKFRSVGDNGIFQTYADVNWKGRNTAKVAPVAVTVAKAFVSVPTKANTAKKNNLANKAANTKGKRISRKQAIEMMKNNKGRFFTVEFTKKDGTMRRLNGQYLKDQEVDPTGLVKVKEAIKMKNNPESTIRNVNINTTHYLKIAGVEYFVK